MDLATKREAKLWLSVVAWNLAIVGAATVVARSENT